ncbi:MAG: TetR/AcrR family transcriptional regulator [Clostridia bacterium]|nr:TetR/AcrR family transcriptional regulator [Clostridia bacterium]
MKVTKDELSRTAIRLFREEGYRNVTVNKICEAAGVTKGSFYHHFDSKDDIILQYWNASSMWTIDRTLQILAQDLPPKEKVWKILEIGVDSAVDDIGRNSMAELWRVDLAQGNRVLSAESFLDGPGIDPSYSKTLLELIRQAQASGAITNPGEPRDLLFAFYSGLFGASVNWSARDEENDVKTDIKKIFDAVFC